MCTKLLRCVGLGMAILVPVRARAAVETPQTFSELLSFFVSIIDTLIVFIFTLAFLVMVWKLVDAWIIHADNDTKRAEGSAVAITAVVVMVVMISLWAILKLLQSGLGY